MSLLGKVFCRSHYDTVNLKVSGSLRGIIKMQFHSYHVPLVSMMANLKYVQTQ